MTEETTTKKPGRRKHAKLGTEARASPIGLSLFIVSDLLGESSNKVAKEIIVPILFFVVALLLITYVPAISLALL